MFLGHPPDQDAGNCANPRFSGSFGAGATSPPDPYLGLAGFPGNPGPNAMELVASAGAGTVDISYRPSFY